MPKIQIAMPLIPVRRIVVFPYMVLHMDVGREKSIAALEAAMTAGQTVFFVSQTDAAKNDPAIEDLYSVGIVAKIRQIIKLPQGYARVLTEGMYRAKLLTVSEDGPYAVCTVRRMYADRRGMEKTDAEAAMRIIDRLLESYFGINSNASRELYAQIQKETELGRYVDRIAAELLTETADRQQILEESNLLERARKLAAILEHEIEVIRSENEIAAKVQESFAQQRRENILREQMRVISKELGDDMESDIAAFGEKMNAMALPDEVREKAQRELSRLSRFPSSSAESNVIYTYLTYLLEMPYGVYSTEKYDIKRAAKILDRDHYGLQKVKERILEHIAVQKLTGNAQGQILCLVGPPGVGKTSIAKSIAEALGRSYARISLGGIHDEAEIRGHRKTYIGAMPGRIADAVKKAGTQNPLLLLDEIDKLGADYKGDPSAALLEVLDPAQNRTFRDHYLEADFSLQDVMFITTANQADQIPAPLLDRMEMITLSGYTEEEKTAIALKHLLPRCMASHGIPKEALHIRKEAIRDMIRYYTREAGVRTLERTLCHLLRRVAKKLLDGETKVSVTAKNLESFLGPYKYIQEKASEQSAVGLATGLAWTAVGGETLEIEVSVLAGDGKVHLTGKLGEVMKESAAAAISYIRSRADALGIDPDFYKKCDLHLHVPEGAVPKDGPSAGVTMATAIASALSGRAVRGEVAMTGEITLRGRVLAVGGIKEKLLAAYRNGKTTILIPKENQRDLEELPPAIRQKLHIIPADAMDTVLEAALLPLASSAALPLPIRHIDMVDRA